MRKLWAWVAILLATATLIIAWQWRFSLPLSLQLFAQPEQTQTHFVAQPELPLIKSERLLTDLQALTFKRYSETDRQKARDYILQALQAAGWTTQIQRFEGGVNIYAERPGRDPNLGSIVLGAHYDSVEASPGADDNATSVATVLEAARLLGQYDTDRTLQIVFFDLEEAGLLGSQAFLAQIEQPKQIEGAVILDMVGYRCDEPGCQTYPSVLPIRPPTDRGNFLAALGDQGHPRLIESFTQPTQQNLPTVLTLAIPTFGGLTPDLVRSDHAPFWKKGIGAVLVTDTANFRNPHYHQASDTLETINPDFFAGSAQIVVNAVTYLLQP